VLLLSAWQLASTTGALPATILPAPTAVIDVGGELIRDGTLIANLGVVRVIIKYNRAPQTNTKQRRRPYPPK
jgi:ABC-type nitrate/sulfonate/bicarbonate transport system permease component